MNEMSYVEAREFVQRAAKAEPQTCAIIEHDRNGPFSESFTRRLAGGAALLATLALMGMSVFNVLAASHQARPYRPAVELPPRPTFAVTASAVEMTVPDPNAAFDSWEYVGDLDDVLARGAESVTVDSFRVAQEKRNTRRRQKPARTHVHGDCLCIIPGDE